jgi:predicted ATPase/transcriptional regulator with XRE-family HTH domain
VTAPLVYRSFWPCTARFGRLQIVLPRLGHPARRDNAPAWAHDQSSCQAAVESSDSGRVTRHLLARDGRPASAEADGGPIEPDCAVTLWRVRAPQPGGDDCRAAIPASADHHLPTPPAEPVPVGSQIQRLRVRAGLTQEALAERAGLSVATIGALEQGRRQPHLHTLAVLAEALGLAPADQAALLELASQSLAHLGTPAGPPPPAPAITRPAAQVRLPTPPTALIGREAEVADATALLDPAGSAVRLLTLAGPGGVGKTRLALAVATALVDVYPDGVFFVDLAPLRDQRLVPATVAHVLELRESGGRSARQLLLDYLHARQLLLVLDNFEHLLGAAPLLAELLEACPRLALLVTSRTVLRLRAEQRFLVAPLATPATANEESPAAIAATPAVQLFIERAKTVAPDFALEASNARAVAAICQRLDGVPLALELAAARVGLLRPDALLLRLEHRLSVLTSGQADLPERQQTLRQTLAWSHDLLGPAEQRLFRRLAVFAGGWTLEATEAVCGGADLPAGEVLERLGVLLDSSLVHRTVGADGELRFGMLETIREDAQERLEAAGEAAEARRRHRDWCLALVEPLAPAPPDPRRLARLAPEHDNLRAALRRAIDRGAVQHALWLAAALWIPWYVRGSYAEGCAWLGEVLALPGAEVATPARAHALIAAAHLAYCQGEYATAERLLEAARLLADHLGDDRLGGVVVHGLANVARSRGDLAAARSLYESALAIYRRLGDRLWEATVLMTLASVLYQQGDLVQAGACAEESLAFFTETSNTWGAARSLYSLAGVAAGQGDHPRARALYEESLALHREVGDHQGWAWTLLALANEVLRSGEASTARHLYIESLLLADKAGDQLTLARCLEGLAGVLATDGQERAVRLAGAADAARAGLGAIASQAERQQLDAWLSAARCALGPEDFSAAWTTGHTLDLRRAAAEALQVPTAAVGDGAPAPPAARPATT